MKRIKSLRDYIAALQNIGEIQSINQEVDWKLELGAIIRRSNELKAPAPLFNNIKDYPSGYRVLGAPGGLSSQVGQKYARIALSLGLEANASMQEIITTLAKAYERPFIPPKVVKNNLFKENLFLGSQVDLFKIPTPLLHLGDGGRYINTWGTIVAQTPDGSWTNWSIARVMIHSKNKMVGLVLPDQHVGLIYSQWKAMNKPMPFALALGCEPVIPFVSSMPLPKYVSEVDFIGAYLGEPVEVVNCETVPLQVPATTEIVLEGYLSLDEYLPEGPMGEYTGYVHLNQQRQWPAYQVSAIAYRNDPILPAVVAGAPIEETQIAWGIGKSAEIYHNLQKENIPVAQCFAPFETAVHGMVVTLQKSYRDRFTRETIASLIGKIVYRSKAGYGITRLMIMDDDIQADDIGDVAWGFFTRCHPFSDVSYIDEMPIPPLVAYLSLPEKQSAKTRKGIYNCLLNKLSDTNTDMRIIKFATGWPAKITAKVIENWESYGYHHLID